ncbi:MAG: PTS glucose transporter subunit IIA [Angelakisella sp.]
MFEKLKNLFGGAKEAAITGILSPVQGKAVSLREVPDPTFSEEMLGKGVAIVPTVGRIVAPAAGKVLGIFRTCHAITLQTESGAELLIHIGIDTVKLDGVHFTPHVKKGDQVQVGDLLIEMDLEAIQAAGYNTITPVLVCNVDDFTTIEGVLGDVNEGDLIVKLNKK